VSIVAIPTAQNRIEHPGQVRQALLVLQLDVPTANLPVDLLLGASADRRKKIRMHSATGGHAPSWAKRISQEVKADPRIVFGAVDIFTVNDMGLAGVDFQSALLEPFGDASHHGFRLRPTAAMQQAIVGIPAKRNLRHLASYPCIKRVMQE